MYSVPHVETAMRGGILSKFEKKSFLTFPEENSPFPQERRK
jgi:hypothetical protein